MNVWLATLWGGMLAPSVLICVREKPGFGVRAQVCCP